MKDIENKLNEHTYSIWKEGLPSFPKLRTYVTFKTNYKLEPYTSIESAFESIKLLIVQFRCGTLPIRFETGRFVINNSVTDFIHSAQNSVLKIKIFFDCTFYRNL